MDTTENIVIGDVEALLERLYVVENNLEELQKEERSMKEAAVPPEVTARLAEIEAAYVDIRKPHLERVIFLRAEIEKCVKSLERRVDSEHYQAVYVKGRTLWDSDKLEGMAILIPALAAARSVGAASVRITPIKKGKGG